MTVNRAVFDNRKKADIKKFHFHMLRHTEATLLVDSGFDKKIVAGYLGHASEKTTERYYLHTDESDRDKVSDLLDTKFSKPFLRILSEICIKPVSR